MSYYVVSATGGYVLAAQEPSSDSIISVLNQTFPPGQATWVGPSPRITRAGTDLTGLATAFMSSSPTVRVAWVFSADNDAQAASVATALQNAFNAWGSGLLGRWTAQVLPYDPAINGDISWWQSGQAAASPSRESASTGQPDENPVGPTTPETAGGGYLNPFAPSPGGTTSPVDSLTRLLTVGGVVIGGATLLYLAWPMLSGARRASARRVARTNPSRRRYRRA